VIGAHREVRRREPFVELTGVRDVCSATDHDRASIVGDPLKYSRLYADVEVHNFAHN